MERLRTAPGYVPERLARIEKIVLHWTAGADGVNEVEADSYHFLVTRQGIVVPGKFSADDQKPPLLPGKYAAHTRAFNSYALGIAMDAMGGAREIPFDPGKYPITPEQIEATARLTAHQARKYGLDVTRRTVLTHAEVPITYGIAQPGKWDVRWIPGMKAPGGAIEVGDAFRTMVRRY